MSSIEFDPLRERKDLIKRMFARDGATLVAQAGERHMWAKRPFIRLPKGSKQGRTKLGEIIAGDALRPQKAWVPWLRPIADMAECEGESGPCVGYATKFRDGVG